jgi:hypothetical protein
MCKPILSYRKVWVPFICSMSMHFSYSYDYHQRVLWHWMVLSYIFVLLFYINFIVVLRNSDDNYKSDRNILVKNNNMWLKIFINVHLLHCHVSEELSDSLIKLSLAWLISFFWAILPLELTQHLLNDRPTRKLPFVCCATQTLCEYRLDFRFSTQRVQCSCYKGI